MANGDVIVFGMQKGGVGKTTLSVNIAALLAHKGYKTLLVDMDTQGTATDYFFNKKPQADTTVARLYDMHDDFNIVTEDDSFIYETRNKNLFIAPASLSLAEADRSASRLPKSYERLKIWIDATAKPLYDYIIIDCPPSMSFLAQNTMVAGDYIVIPTMAVPESFEALKLYISLLKRTKVLKPDLKILGAILNRYIENRTVFSLYADKFKESGVPILATIHDCIDYSKLAHNKKFVSDFPELSRQRIGKELKLLASTILDKIKNAKES